jgi:hypothetical protein
LVLLICWLWKECFKVTLQVKWLVVQHMLNSYWHSNKTPIWIVSIIQLPKYNITNTYIIRFPYILLGIIFYIRYLYLAHNFNLVIHGDKLSHCLCLCKISSQSFISNRTSTCLPHFIYFTSNVSITTFCLCLGILEVCLWI